MPDRHTFAPSPLLCGPRPTEGEIHIKPPFAGSAERPNSKGEIPHG